MRDVSAQRVPVVVIQFRDIFKVRRALSYQSAFVKKRYFCFLVETVLFGKRVHICQELIFRDADQRVFDLASDILSHRDNALLAPLVMARAAMGLSFHSETIVLGFRLFRDLSKIVAGSLSVNVFVI